MIIFECLCQTTLPRNPNEKRRSQPRYVVGDVLGFLIERGYRGRGRIASPMSLARGYDPFIGRNFGSTPG